MKIKTLLVIAISCLIACKPQKEKTPLSPLAIQGTWKLISSYKITKTDTVNTSPAKNIEMIKIINDTHFAFFSHDISRGKTPNPSFSAGAGSYKLNGNQYTENLAYCNYREWENHSFDFTVKLNGDTLTQKGTEKIDSLKIEHEIIEVYVRKKD